MPVYEKVVQNTKKPLSFPEYPEYYYYGISRVLTLQTSCNTKCALFESNENDLLELTVKLLLITIN